MLDGYLRHVPAELRDLAEIALDLRWTTSRLTRSIWERLDREAWEQCESPYLILINASQDRLEEAARDRELLQELSHWRNNRDEYYKAPIWYATSHPPPTCTMLVAISDCCRKMCWGSVGGGSWKSWDLKSMCAI